ncbi:hypothetical protein Cal7507_4333 [Calothrix sp. PCC 7507]|nr:hypothetical protein Cal7507_4333 [Calothrix sp. PCC 7507]
MGCRDLDPERSVVQVQKKQTAQPNLIFHSYTSINQEIIPLRRLFGLEFYVDRPLLTVDSQR